MALGLIVGCRSTGPVLIELPEGLGDTISVPQELQAQYDAIVAENPWHAPYDLDFRPLNERRAYSYYFFSKVTNSEPNTLLLIGHPSRQDALLGAALWVGQSFGAAQVDSRFIICPEYYLHWAEPKTWGELAWIADWTLVNCPQYFLVAGPATNSF